MSRRERVEWVDIAKGITILLTIASHSIVYGFWYREIRALIFAFHMPLFFVMSGVTFRFSNSMEEFVKGTKRGFKHLCLTGIWAYLAIIILEIIKSDFSEIVLTKEYWLSKIYTLVYSSGYPLDLNGMGINAIGVIWFLFALWGGRTLYDSLQMNVDSDKLPIYVWLISLIGVLFGRTMWMPVSLDIALAVFPFFYMGHMMQLKKFNPSVSRLKRTLILLPILLIIVALMYPDNANWTYFELAPRHYTMYPLCFISAGCGVTLVCILSGLISKIKILSVPLKFIGKNSMDLFLVHFFDQFWSVIWSSGENTSMEILKRLASDLIVFFAFIGVKLLIKCVLKKRTNNRMV